MCIGKQQITRMPRFENGLADVHVEDADDVLMLEVPQKLHLPHDALRVDEVIIGVGDLLDCYLRAHHKLLLPLQSLPHVALTNPHLLFCLGVNLKRRDAAVGPAAHFLDELVSLRGKAILTLSWGEQAALLTFLVKAKLNSFQACLQALLA